MEQIEGTFEKATFEDKIKNFTIGKVKTQRFGLVTFLANFSDIPIGSVLELKGEWEEHKTWGKQFKVIAFSHQAPSTADGIEKYLSSGLIKGIGPRYAKRIIAKFGDKAMDIIESNPTRLLEIEGIGRRRIWKIQEAWEKQKHIKELFLYLKEFNITPSLAAKIYKQYGDHAVSVLKDNPYKLTDDIYGIGFKTADEIALSLKIPSDSFFRIKAAINHFLKMKMAEGNCYFIFGRVVDEVARLTNLEKGLIAKSLYQCHEENSIVVRNSFDKKNEKITYLPFLIEAEERIAGRLEALLKADYSYSKDNVPDIKQIESLFTRLNLGIKDSQVKAIQTVLSSKVCIITGGPGTGKTTITKVIVNYYKNKTKVLLAPTGKAANRLRESTGHEAFTIHRFLSFADSKGKDNLRRKYESLEIIILDEATMADVFIMDLLLSVVPDHARMIFIGDADQLPSVGPGNVLNDLILSKCLPTIRLNEIIRQESHSQIILQAHHIRNGRAIDENISPNNDFFFIEKDNPDEILQMIDQMVKERIPNRFNLNPIEDIQLLVPMHRGLVGIQAINQRLQNLLNPQSHGNHIEGSLLRIGDKVIQLKNNYDKKVFNGNMGVVHSYNSEESLVEVQFDEMIAPYDLSELDELQLSYAISVHKSQGSEYKAVIIPLLKEHYLLLFRNLLYTAVTRAKQLVIIIGQREALDIAIQRNKPIWRYTSLAYQLQASDT